MTSPHGSLVARSFSPIATRRSRLLILGSMPGQVSLAQSQYYAHPRNAFWPIMAALLDFNAAASYRQRILELRRHGIALWDVLRLCRRPGSLDSAIESDTAQCNDLDTFLHLHTHIHTVCFNGAKAEQLFRRYIQHQPLPPNRILRMHRLPSTSPAHAALGLADKHRHWRKILEYLEADN